MGVKKRSVEGKLLFKNQALSDKPEKCLFFTSSCSSLLPSLKRCVKQGKRYLPLILPLSLPPPLNLPLPHLPVTFPLRVEPAFFPSWGFNSMTGACESFIFGGCGGNANIFETEEECM